MKKIKIHRTYERLLADTLTPVGIYLNLRDHYPGSHLLESSDYHSKADSLSFICLEPIAGFEAKGCEYNVQFPSNKTDSFKVNELGEILPAFQNYIDSFTYAKDNLPFRTAGLFGYSSFEAFQYFDDLELTEKRCEIKSNPDLIYHHFKYVIVIDHFKNELFIVKHDTEPLEENDKDIAHLKSLIAVNHIAQFSFKITGDETSSTQPEEFRSMVEKGIAHCQRGDVFQVVLSREFNQPFKGDDFNVYRSLRNVNPSPYLFYFDYGKFKIFGSSPESQLQVNEGRAFIDPIAGTARRTGDAEKDMMAAEELKANPKEYAEHIMLVDLARNDLSRHTNEVEVEECAEIQYFSHVIHMVSKVSGELIDERSGLQIFADTFPAGTLSGAPKYRAMQIIDEQENQPRNFYGGAIGFFGFDGSVNHAIIIRSVLSKNNKLTYQAGAGVVVESSPQGELDEVDNKVAAMRRAIAKAEEI
ncbi:MAG: anthranilate synthase component I family protein [Flavobacteriales bacterium]|nr:anthranilate synthase component I family protein [Flavobacteriales bacterium]